MTEALTHLSSEIVDAALMDEARLMEIAELDLMSTDVDSILEKAAADAATQLGLPIGLVSIVLDEALYFAAMHGVDGWILEARGHPVEWSFCRFAVATKEAFVVEDASVHPLMRDNPLVTEMGVRSYAGIPLISSRGNAIGSFCVVGGEPRSFTDAELMVLRGFAASAMQRLEARRATK